MNPANLRIAKLLRSAERFPHGTRARYVGARCRCLRCRAANSRYQCVREAKRRCGLSDPLIDASIARQHIFELAKMGVGKRSVAAASSVCLTIIQEIRAGKRLRRSTENRILAVDVNAATGRALISSRVTWALIDELLRRGFSKLQLATWMGYKSRALQFKRGKRITAASAARVRRMYEFLKQGKLKRS